MAASALALGIVGVLFSLLPGVGYAAGIPISLIALGLGLWCRREARRLGESAPGMARTAVILGIVGSVLGVVMGLVWTVWLR